MGELTDMYVAFRQEIDSYCAELIISNLETRPLIYEGKAVGFLILDDDYVDSFYIMPEFRKKGIGSEYIIGEYRRDICKWHDLRVVKTNFAAHKFWNKIFNLRIIDTNFCDIHYEILGLKEPDYDT